MTVQERIDQLVAFVERMRDPDIVRPDEEASLRHLAQLVAGAALETVEDVVMGEPAWPRPGAIRRRPTMDKIRTLTSCPRGCGYAMGAHIEGRCPTEAEAIQKWGRS